jgi:excisionase family DNA binding protein
LSTEPYTSGDGERVGGVPAVIRLSNGMSRSVEISGPHLDEAKGIEKLLTPDEVAILLDVKMSWVMDHVTRIEPIIPHLRIGKMIRFRRQDVTQWLDSMVSTKATWE